MSNRNKSSEFDDGSDVTGVFTMVDDLIGTDGVVIDEGHFTVFVNRVPGTIQLNFPSGLSIHFHYHGYLDD